MSEQRNAVKGAEARQASIALAEADYQRAVSKLASAPRTGRHQRAAKENLRIAEAKLKEVQPT